MQGFSCYTKSYVIEIGILAYFDCTDYVIKLYINKMEAAKQSSNYSLNTKTP